VDRTGLPQALVTGGAGGIGGAVVTALVALGYAVTATAYDEGELAPRRSTPAFAEVDLATLDVADPGAVERFAEGFDRLDVLVNCAGVTARGPRAFEEDMFTWVLDVNLTGTMRTCRAFHPQLAACRGVVVNIASMMSFFGTGTAPGYAASKGGVAQLTKSLAIAWAEEGIRVNAVAPGWIQTPMGAAVESADPELYRRVLQRTPMGRWGTPEDVAGAVVFLCSDAAAFVTGVILPVDGGYSVA
jgi:NAD(P)-dependent dehydrogenase (short-subunit alcohol dehydrogenase family)